MAVEREVKSHEYQIRLARKKRRYHRDSDFRNRILAINRESKRRHRRGEVKNPKIAKKWRLTRLGNQIEETAEALRTHNQLDLVRLFRAGETDQTFVYLSPAGHLALRPAKTEFEIPVQSAYDLYGAKKVFEALKVVRKSLGLKK